MPSPHADGEDLARLAMQDEVPAEVAAHVESCAECTRDLALIRSLLDAGGPDGSDSGGADSGPAELTEASDAWADGSDSGSGHPRAPAELPVSEQPAEAIASTTPGRRHVNSTALVVALLLFVGAILLAFFALR